MTIERHSNEHKVDLPQEEMVWIERNLPHLQSLFHDILGNPLDFDRYAEEVEVCEVKNKQPTGLILSYALYGEPDFENKLNQCFKITLLNEFVIILIDKDGAIDEIHSNINSDEPHPISQWLYNRYKQIDKIMDNNVDYYVSPTAGEFAYRGKEDVEKAKEIYDSLNKEIPWM